MSQLYSLSSRCLCHDVSCALLSQRCAMPGTDNACGRVPAASAVRATLLRPRSGPYRPTRLLRDARY
eukprot:434524-Rhodomonas_salina.2